MAIRQRAIQAEDKQERHEAILDAAERLLLRSPDRVASVSEVVARIRHFNLFLADYGRASGD